MSPGVSEQPAECEKKKISRRSLSVGLTEDQPLVEEKTENENVVASVANISENDAGFYIDAQQSQKLFYEIWKTENKLPKEALEFLAKRSRKTIFAVRTWFYRHTKKVFQEIAFINLTCFLKNNDRLHKEKEANQINESVQNEIESDADSEFDKEKGEKSSQEFFISHKNFADREAEKVNMK